MSLDPAYWLLNSFVFSPFWSFSVVIKGNCVQQMNRNCWNLKVIVPISVFDFFSSSISFLFSLYHIVLRFSLLINLLWILFYFINVAKKKQQQDIKFDLQAFGLWFSVDNLQKNPILENLSIPSSVEWNSFIFFKIFSYIYHLWLFSFINLPVQIKVKMEKSKY